jgi:hypothetical protein
VIQTVFADITGIGNLARSLEGDLGECDSDDLQNISESNSRTARTKRTGITKENSKELSRYISEKAQKINRIVNFLTGAVGFMLMQSAGQNLLRFYALRHDCT